MNETMCEIIFHNGTALQIVQGDLTEEEVDAIVNAANAELQHGGGVAGAILRKGGEAIQEESNAWVEEHGPVSHHRPAYTSAGNLFSRYVIHAVGPVWGSGEEDKSLSEAVQGTLEIADQLGLASIAMPAISTGIYGFPIERAASVILNTINGYFKQHPNSSVHLVRVVLYEAEAARVFMTALDALFTNQNAD